MDKQRVLDLAMGCGAVTFSGLLYAMTPDELLSFAAALQLEAREEQQTAWLCERGGDGPTRYVCVDPSGFFDWTEDVNKALRLCRREDADAVAAIVDDCWRVAEHRWG